MKQINVFTIWPYLRVQNVRTNKMIARKQIISCVAERTKINNSDIKTMSPWILNGRSLSIGYIHLKHDDDVTLLFVQLI